VPVRVGGGADWPGPLAPGPAEAPPAVEVDGPAAPAEAGGGAVVGPVDPPAAPAAAEPVAVGAAPADPLEHPDSDAAASTPTTRTAAGPGRWGGRR